MSSMVSVLIVDDDQRLAKQTAKYLEGRGMKVAVANDGDAGQELALRSRFDCIVLDLTLPGRDGIDVCRELRARTDTPIIMVTGRVDEADVVLGLEVGADDYLTKPFSSRILLARIRAAVRRSHARNDSTVRVGRLVLDPASLGATLDGKHIDLTAHEFTLLLALARRAGEVVARDHLQRVSGGSGEGDRAIDVHVSHLRQKLGDDSRNPRILKTIRGAGYLLAASGW